MTSPIFRVALSGLNAAQAGLATTAHNIANANTPGYSRQEVLLATQSPVFSGGGYFGRGVTVQSVVRRYDQYLDQEAQRAQSQSSRFEAMHAQAASVDALLGDPQMGLEPALAGFFEGVNAVAANPGDTAARQSMISSAQTLTARFRLLGEAIDERNHAIDQRLEADAAQVNTYTQQIARLNDRISQASGTGAPPNDLLDQRDQLVRELGKLLPAQTVVQDDGAMNVYLGGGQALVVGNRNYAVAAMRDPFDASRRTLGLDTGAGNMPLDGALITGGEIGGTLAARREVLDPAQDALGRLATVLGDAFNAQHRQGVDLAGAAGGDFFGVSSPWISGASTNAGSAQLQAAFSATANLTGQDYEILFTGTGYVATLSDGTTKTFASLPATLDGVTINLASGAPAAGDRFLLRPTRDGATGLSVAITDPTRIAAGQPPSSGVGDNRNARLLAQLQTSRIVGSGTASLGDAYGALVADVGQATQSAEIGAKAQAALLAEAQTAAQAVSGVNLDEEAANLLRLQQAYQAAGKTIQVAGTLFDTLLQLGR